MKRFLLVAILGLAMTGCASTSGNSSVSQTSSESLKQQIVEGKTTAKDVEAKFGKPQTVQKTKKGETWIYQYGKASSDALGYVPVVGMFIGTIEGTSKTVTIEFDKKGVVRDVEFTETKEQLKSGFAG
ncbi:MAG: hypothetical protein ACRCU9_03180 [Iodobacter sp.]